jgi:hypothetical protein
MMVCSETMILEGLTAEATRKKKNGLRNVSHAALAECGCRHAKMWVSTTLRKAPATSSGFFQWQRIKKLKRMMMMMMMMMMMVPFRHGI